MSKKNKPKESGAGANPSQRALSEVLAAGDYRAAETEARRLLADPASTGEQRSTAKDILARVAVDPGAKYVGLIALSVLVMVAGLLYLH